MNILCGFESEFFPTEIKWYKQLLRDNRLDYLILGIHDVINLEPENNFNFNCKTPKDLKKYYKAFSEGMKTNLFIYAAHPDFFMKSYENWDKHAIKLANKIVDLSIKLDFPLGLNINGIWKGKRKIGNSFRNKYPIEEFWQIAKKKKAKIILESDVHHIAQLEDKTLFNKVLRTIKNWGLEDLIIEKLDFDKYKKKLEKIL